MNSFTEMKFQSVGNSVIELTYTINTEPSNMMQFNIKTNPSNRAAEVLTSKEIFNAFVLGEGLIGGAKITHSAMDSAKVISEETLEFWRKVVAIASATVALILLLIVAIVVVATSKSSRQNIGGDNNGSFSIVESEKTEEMSLRQAKLVLGFRVAAAEPNGAVMAARLMNTLWGGCPSSLLFRHVREEQSLCYYCSSSYDRFQGVILVDSGVEAADAARTREEVLKQLDAIREGNFSDDELEAARRALIQRFTSMNETPADRELWTVGQTLYDRYFTPEQAISELLAVTREDVCRVAKQVHFDSAYLLRPITDDTAAKE